MSKTLAAPLEGHTFKLRPTKMEDTTAWVNIEQDPHIHRMFGGSVSDIKPKSQEDARHFIQRLINHPCAWTIDINGFVGEVRLDRIDMPDRRASYAIGIYDPAWLGKGIGTQATKLVLEHAFRSIGLHRVSLRVLAYNTRAIRSYEKCGFTVEGREREAGLVDGQWHDDIIMGVLDREFLNADTALPRMR